MAARISSRRLRPGRVGAGELRLAILAGVALGLAAAAGFDPPAQAHDARIPRSQDQVVRRFAPCGHGVYDACVVDGDTFRLGGEKIRIADIDTPETHPSRCAREARLGRRATDRLAELLSAGPFVLESIDRDTDRYGRRLRIVTRRGESLCDQLVEEGLARRWEGRRRPWCVSNEA